MAPDNSVTAGLEPPAFWEHFAAITRIPRPPHGEGPMIEHVRAWAADHGFELDQDAAGNVVVRVPGTAGRETAPVVIIQGHLDMVCERRPDSPNDPAEGRIALVRDGAWLMADGTTLGADDGVAIAAMMALAGDASAVHGPLELLMTVAEEVGLEGASNLDGGLLTGSVMLNLDGEDGGLTVGCAGAADTWIHVRRPRAACDADAVSLEVTVSGGLGGHSGGNIADGRANAIKTLARVLRDARETVPFRLVAMNGGRSRNAVPRDASAVCSVLSGQTDAFRAAVEGAARAVREEYARTDPGVTVATAEAAPAADAWARVDTAVLLDLVALVPSGPLAFSPDFDGVVETSTSLGQSITEGDRLTLQSLSRSSSAPALANVIATLVAAARLVDGTIDVAPGYPGWQPDLGSPTLALASTIYERRFGSPPLVTAVHGGVEPAVIGGKLPGLDMISFGPEIQFPHSPDERLNIESVERFWSLLLDLLDELSNTA